MIIDGITLPSGETLDSSELSVLDDNATTAKAWVTFNGTNGSIKDNFNIQSVNRTAIGVYTITFTNPMNNVNYAVVGNAVGSGGGAYHCSVLGSGTPNTTTTFAVNVRNVASHDMTDLDNVSVIVFGN